MIAPIIGHETIRAKVVSHKVRSKSIQPCTTAGKTTCLEKKKFDILYCEIVTEQETFGADADICQKINDDEEREFEVRGVWTPITRRTITKAM